MEAALLGAFMVTACTLATLLEHPGSPVHRALPDRELRRGLMGVAMGLTAVTLIRSPWGRQSGGHMNPSLTLTYFRLGKIALRDAAGYGLAQFAGGAAGVLLTVLAAGEVVSHPAVGFAATRPGDAGAAIAWGAEFVISGVLMLVVLVTSNTPRLARWTPVCAGLLIALYITVEAPLSGMSMNPARSFASALGIRDWSWLWIYFTAPPLGMLAAAELYVRRWGRERVSCAKLDHDTTRRCIFRCAHRPAAGAARRSG